MGQALPPEWGVWKAAPKPPELWGNALPMLTSEIRGQAHPLTALRGTGLPRVRAAEEWRRARRQRPQGLPQTRQPCGGRPGTGDWPLPLGGQASPFLLGKPACGSRGPSPCAGGKAPAQARRACQQRRHRGHSGRAPGRACPSNDPGPGHGRPACPLPSCKASALGRAGVQSALGAARRPESVASAVPKRGPTMNTPRTPHPHPHPSP